MPKRIRIDGTGEIVEIPDGMSIEAALQQYHDNYMQRMGVDLNFQENSKKRQQEAVARANQQWIEDNPVNSKVASYQAGARDLGRNLLQMATPEAFEEDLGVDDESMHQKALMESPLREANPVSFGAGQVVPSLAVPVGGGANAAAQGGGRVLSEAIKRMATTSIPRAGAEGAVFGAAVAGPEGRAGGAALGGAGGVAGNVLGRTLSRLGTGAAPMTPQAKAVAQHMGQTPGGKEPFIPIQLAAGQTGPGGATRFLYEHLLRLMPSAGKRLNKQAGEVSQQAYEHMLRQAYGKHADQVVEKFLQKGNLEDAVLLGEQLLQGPAGNFTKPMRRVLQASSGRATEGLPSFRQIEEASQALFKGQGSKAPLRQFAIDMQKLFAKAKGEPGVAERALFYMIIRNNLGHAGFSIGRVLASPAVQKAIMGSTKAQQAFLKAINSGRASHFSQYIGRLAREAGIELTMDQGQDAYNEIKERLNEQG